MRINGSKTPKTFLLPYLPTYVKHCSAYHSYDYLLVPRPRERCQQWICFISCHFVIICINSRNIHTIYCLKINFIPKISCFDMAKPQKWHFLKRTLVDKKSTWIFFHWLIILEPPCESWSTFFRCYSVLNFGWGVVCIRIISQMKCTPRSTCMAQRSDRWLTVISP